jgi:hypothetical protein
VIPQGKFLTGGIVRESRKQDRNGVIPLPTVKSGCKKIAAQPAVTIFDINTLP